LCGERQTIYELGTGYVRRLAAGGAPCKEPIATFNSESFERGDRCRERRPTPPHISCLTRCGISGPCDATTPEGFGPETSRWATWCFSYDKTTEGATSSRLPGKAIHHRQDFEARNVQAGQQSRRGLQQRLEHSTATSLLPLRCFQVVHAPRLHTPIKSNHQGRVSLASAKPDPP
jgi:hypothetical protein